MDTIKLASKGNVRMVAHRGCSGLEKENTLPAFVAAANRSYYGIETDVHRTKDGKFVLHHDASTLRVTGVDLPIAETEFDVLRALPVLDKDGESTRIDLRLPIPEEYFSICHRYDKVAVFELKDNFNEEELAALCDIIASFGHMENTVFISFGLEVLVRLRELRPDVTIQFLTKTFSPELLDTLTENRFGLDIYYGALDAEKIALCHEKGITVNTWTVDDPAIAESLIAWGVDMITTNILE